MKREKKLIKISKEDEVFQFHLSISLRMFFYQPYVYSPNIEIETFSRSEASNLYSKKKKPSNL